MSWEELVQDQADEAFLPYAMKTRYKRDDFILHHTFGKGVVTADERTRIVVLFETGMKKLVHGIEPPGPEPEQKPEPEYDMEPEP